MDFIRSSLQRKKLSGPVIAFLLDSKRPSTLRLYQARWAKFNAYCVRKTLLLSEVSVPHIADFLVELFNAKSAHNTIKGYLTAILNTLNSDRVVKLDPVDPVFTDLFRSFRIARPLKHSIAPKWNMVLVFNALTKPPFEPLEKAQIKQLSMKTLFLILMASPKRRGHVHHLDASNVSFARNDREVAIGVLPEFVSKRQADYKKPVQHTLVIPALSSASDRADLSLCPVRAVRMYLEATKSYRRSRKRFFLPLAKEKEDFKADVLTHWIRHLIIHSYKNCTTEEATLHRVLHETRGIATSWALLKNVPMDSLLSVAEWKNHNVFTNNYLRDMTHSQNGMLSLGPIVVAQHVV
jgi:hypothetical protein